MVSAAERRDGDPDRFAGRGVLGVLAAVNTEILDALAGRSLASLADLDGALIELDGTEGAFIADLAVGTGCKHMRSGVPARGERVAKHNRLIEIDDAARLAYGLRGARS